MKDTKEGSVAPEYQFNIDEMPITSNLLSVHQDGNYLVGVTEYGVKFKQRIPSDKMLSKNDKGEWILVPLRNDLGNSRNQ